ncbi:hypothetical protein WKR88_09785 [Trinickia caryophylli]|uniref:Uncharacterized protein n=1 Tax=Trinickia caryophylli TaxID=28094 RepID=A0A1X7FA76_TRICW|nr:hypothetical protein [Trinickia caryophylli]TRX18964.1 hypothetical protein FNF07_12480 [Trinickia caryophylli]WQE10237.1 hypothetical protein U0034_10445 [Trinickia caryophylli]GLU34320.1 hypothetical protein Busp01_41620 [Trinickia caryophylli]SMF48275.1 hypothetical protein SAMN06295900_10841 [Trinickia caryophylli]
MTEETFRWHPDRDDVYDGNVFKDTLLGDVPCSAFRKIAGKSFTMNGGSHSLTLAPVPEDIDVFMEWGEPAESWIDNPPLTRIAINSGTLKMVAGVPTSTAVAVLGLGVEDAVVQLDITGTFTVQDVNVEGSGRPVDDGPVPASTINIYPNGRFLVGKENATRVTGFAGGFDINVHDGGTMSVTAHTLDLTSGTYTIGDRAAAGPCSVELIAQPATASPGDVPVSDADGALLSDNLRISCTSASSSRLQAISMAFTATHIKAEDTASLTIGCNSIAFDESVKTDRPVVFETGTIFAVGQGSAVISFTSASGGPAPFKFTDMAREYPKGLFNFVTADGANKGKFKFLDIGSAFDFSAMIHRGLITIDGTPDNGAKTTWGWEVDPELPSRSYFTIHLK